MLEGLRVQSSEAETRTKMEVNNERQNNITICIFKENVTNSKS